jgi:hypothetical protein
MPRLMHTTKCIIHDAIKEGHFFSMTRLIHKRYYAAGWFGSLCFNVGGNVSRTMKSSKRVTLDNTISQVD